MIAQLARAWHRANFVDSSAPLAFDWRGPLKFLPIILCGGFFGFSVIWLAIGPLDWHISNSSILFVFLGASILALVAGYYFGIQGFRRRSKSALPEVRPRTTPFANPNKVLIVSGLVGLVLYLPTVYATTGQWIPDVVGGLTNPGAAYRATKELNETGSPTIHYIRFLASPILILAAPITYFLWPRLSWVARALGLFSILGVVALSIAQGINKGMADLTAYTCLFFALIAISSLRKGRRKRLLGSVVGAGLVVSLFLAYYAVSIQSRIAGDVARAESSAVETGEPPAAPDASPPIDGQTTAPSTPNVSDEEVAEAVDSNVTMGVATERESHFIYSLPGGLKASTLVLSSYVTHSYRGLSMALTESWTPTYGLGFSEFFRHNLAKALGGDEFEQAIEARSYAGKITEDGWPVGQLWATFFIDPASDISFPGVVALLGVVGFFFGRSWRDTVTRGDPIAAAVFFSFCTLVFYLPANNQLFQGGETAIGFTVVFIAWLFLRSNFAARLTRREKPVADPDDHTEAAGRALIEQAVQAH